MEKGQKKSFRRAYLDDFRQDASGEYVYGGKHYELSGEEKEKRRFFILLFACMLLAAVFTVLPECFGSVGADWGYLILLPWLGQLIAVFLTEWSCMRLWFRGGDLRAYVYEATVKRIPVRAAASMILCGISFLALIVCWILFGAGEDPSVFLIRLPFPPLCALSCLGIFFLVRRSVWRERE